MGEVTLRARRQRMPAQCGSLVAAALFGCGIVAAQDAAPAATTLRGRVVCERATTGSVRVAVRALADRGDGRAAPMGKFEWFERAPDVEFEAKDGAWNAQVSTAPGVALFAWADVDGDGRWTPAAAEPCAWIRHLPTPPGEVEVPELVLRAPTPLPTADREVAHGALRWLRGYPIVQLRGTGPQRGRAHGELLAPQIVDFFRFYLLEDRLGGAAAYREFAAFLQSHFDWPEPFLQEIDGVLAGMRDSGTDLRVPELGRDFGRTELLAINAYIETRAMRSSCTQFVCWGERTAGSDVDGGTIAGRNMDGEIDLRRVTVSHFVLFAVDPAEPGLQRYVSMMWPGFVGTLSGFNAAGVHCMENAGGTGQGPVVGGLQPISWTMRQALATLGADAGPVDFEALLQAHANDRGGACGPGCIVVFALPQAAAVRGFVVEGDRFGHATRLPGAVPPRMTGAILASNHHLVYGVGPSGGPSFGRQPSWSSAWRYEAGRHRLEGMVRAGRPIGTAAMRELLQTVAHGTSEHSLITRPDRLEFDVARASMQAEPWDAPYRQWTTFSFAELFADGFR